MPTVAHASATGIAACALSVMMASARASPMRVPRRTHDSANEATSAQNPANIGDRPSTSNHTSTAGPTSRCASRRSTAPSRGSSARESTGRFWRIASKWTITPTAMK